MTGPLRLLTLFSALFAAAYAWADSLPPAGLVPMDRMLERVAKDYPGRVLKVELEDEDDGPSGWVYEVKILREDGRVVEVELDAKSLDVIEVEEGHDWLDRLRGRRGDD
ncbi:PepSY domain-containing protein [Magnetospira sp. QH-2]|uniref:PepSY domain-containing protein n=1 Tax=Magnetospira sp. (strain QH-2) TaxID=1288970 RepID=UPI0003E81BCE|nr:PepSY domain-containing protein [Magnetospira sp. QH-2]CCQ75059.1 exported protein of unknown function [Magnetospira sp. QH-2]